MRRRRPTCGDARHIDAGAGKPLGVRRPAFRIDDVDGALPALEPIDDEWHEDPMGIEGAVNESAHVARIAELPAPKRDRSHASFA